MLVLPFSSCFEKVIGRYTVLRSTFRHWLLGVILLGKLAWVLRLCRKCYWHWCGDGLVLLDSPMDDEGLSMNVQRSESEEFAAFSSLSPVSDQ